MDDDVKKIKHVQQLASLNQPIIGDHLNKLSSMSNIYNYHSPKTNLQMEELNIIDQE